MHRPAPNRESIVGRKRAALRNVGSHLGQDTNGSGQVDFQIVAHAGAFPEQGNHVVPVWGRCIPQPER
eukprot:13798082-Alexandrium_andersonii.AAC.1